MAFYNNAHAAAVEQVDRSLIDDERRHPPNYLSLLFAGIKSNSNRLAAVFGY
jgi:hypothetical protein